MLRFDEGVAVVQKGGRGGCGPYCQNLRPRYRSTHRHTLEELIERGERGGGRGREEKEREGRNGVKGRERLDAEMRQKGKEGRKDASRKPNERRFISVTRLCYSTSPFRAIPLEPPLSFSITRTRCGL